MELTYSYRNLADVSKFDKDPRIVECVRNIDGVGNDMLLFNENFVSNNYDSQYLIKYFGIGLDVISKIDIWEIEYLVTMAQEFRTLKFNSVKNVI